MIPELCLTLKHSITVTDYTVRVWRATHMDRSKGRWVAQEKLGTLALTGLARKILRKSGMIEARGWPSRLTR
jgi:hypothetical protein